MAQDILGMLQTGSSSLRITKPQKTSKVLESNIRHVSNANVLPKKPSGGFTKRWRVEGTHLISNAPPELDLSQHKCEDGKVKVAAFDLDWTLVKTKNGGTHPRGPQDWVFWSSNVASKIKDLVEKKHLIVLFSNQGAVVVNSSGPRSKSYQNFSDRVDSIFRALKQAVGDDFELLVFAAPKRPGARHLQPSSEAKHLHMRKPQSGMWEALEAHIEALDEDAEIDLQNSFFVGDAAGRPNDFLDSDKAFATNVRVKFFTPEDFF